MYVRVGYKGNARVLSQGFGPVCIPLLSLVVMSCSGREKKRYQHGTIVEPKSTAAAAAAARQLFIFQEQR